MEVERQFAFLRRFFTPRTVFLQTGARDCALALEAATYVERVYALGVAEGLTRGVRLPCNLRLGEYREARRQLREAGFSDVRFPFLLSVFQRQKIVAGVR